MARFYYNGILLPEIPADALATHPYAFIRNNSTTGCYDLLLAIQPFYYDESDTRLVDNGGQTDLWYKISISTASSATSWGAAQSHEYRGWTIDANRTVLWTNTNVYIEGTTEEYQLYKAKSNPIPEDAIVHTSGTFLIQGETLSEIANAIRMMTGLVGPIQTEDMPNLIKSIGQASTITFSSRQMNNTNNG